MRDQLHRLLQMYVIWKIYPNHTQIKLSNFLCIFSAFIVNDELEPLLLASRDPHPYAVSLLLLLGKNFQISIDAASVKMAILK